MKNVRMTRVAANPNHGCFSTWVLDGQPICVALEPYHRNNLAKVSCIPTGQYLMKRYDSPSYGPNMWEITNVGGRSYILVHWGNRDFNTQGCVLLGEEFGTLQGDWAVLSSKKAYNEFMSLTKNEREMVLTVVEAY